MIRTVDVGVLLRTRTTRDSQIDSTRVPNVTILSVFVFGGLALPFTVSRILHHNHNEYTV